MYTVFMQIPILTTKLYIPHSQNNVVSRDRLIKLLNDGLHGKMILLSAPVGFGMPGNFEPEWVATFSRIFYFVDSASSWTVIGIK